MSIDRFANELLDEILSYLPTLSDQHSVLSTCRSLHWPAARRLYRHVSISDYKARRFLKTITESTLGYEIFTKTLKYNATSNTDVYLNHVLLRDAIPRLQNLENLSLSVRSSLSPFLIYLLKRTDDAKTFHGLDKLHTFRLHGDLRLLKCVTYHRIKKMEILEAMSEDEFAYFLGVTVIPGSSTNLLLSDLIVTFRYNSRMHIVYAIMRIAERFPNLRRLGIRGPSLKALDISLLMTLNPPLLPHLNTLEVNQISIIQPYSTFISTASQFHIQSNHLTEAGRMRSDLRRVTFGQVAWDRVPASNAWVMSYQLNATDEDVGMLPENFPGRLVEWAIEYSEPIDIGQLQAFQKKKLLQK